MNTISKLLLATALLTASAVSPASAGTQADPEYTDPAGDVPFLLAPGQNADWADIVGAWFEPIPGGVRVNIEALDDTSHPDEDVQFYVNWDVLAGQDEHCYATMYVNLADGDEMALSSTDALLNYTCAEETQPYTIPIADVTVELSSLWDGGTFPVATNGPVASVDIPFSVFSEGQTASLYQPGTGLQFTSVSSQLTFDMFFLIGDQHDLCRPTYSPPFGFESGCPEDARIYTIGG